MNVIYIYVILLLIPLIAAIRLINAAKRLNNTINEKDLSGFEIAKDILKNKDTYIVEKRASVNNFYDDSRDTLKFSTNVFHDSDVFVSVIASYYATSVTNKNIWKSALQKVLDIANLLSFLFFIVGILTYSLDFIYVATGIIIISLSLGIINLSNCSRIADNAVNYLIKKRIVSEEYIYLKDVVKYIFIARIVTVIIDFILNSISKIKK